jgi:excisionase family DNA binding protein
VTKALDHALLTTAEVAKTWHVSLRTVQRYIADGKLPAVQLPGGHYRIRVDVARAVFDTSANGDCGRGGLGFAHAPTTPVAAPPQCGCSA